MHELSHSERIPDNARASPVSRAGKAAAMPALNPLWQRLAARLQPKLTVNQPGDPYEQEADRVADQVMRMPAGEALQRMCPACEEELEVQRTSITATAVDEEEEEQIQAKHEAASLAPGPDRSAAPSIVDDVLGSSGEPLDHHTRHFMESRFGHDFGGVRVHTGAQASASARAVQALAYTVGNNIVFGSGRYAPSENSGRRLLAHELTHVIQQSGAGPRAAPRIPVANHSSGTMLSRQNTAQTTSVLSRGLVAGVQFILDGTMNSTAVGPVSGATAVSVIVGRLTTIRELARVLLPLWNTATPFTPAGATTPVALTPLTVDDLAKGLLAYNRYRPATPPAAVPPVMTKWMIGMRFPLPIRIDSATNEGILHPDPIHSLAASFDPTWTSLLDELPAVLPAQPAAELTQSATDFLNNEPSAAGRGIRLGSRALANAQQNREFILEVFNQAGAAAFDIALEFMDNLVNRHISLLAAQPAGAAILARIQALLASPPATATPAQQSKLTRANGMLGRVSGVQAQPEPCVPNRQLTWANFAGAVPAGAPAHVGAMTRFRINHVAHQGVNLFQAVLDQGTSWVRPAASQAGNVAVNGCQPNITACQNFFNGGPGSGAQWNHPGGAVGCAAAIGPPATTANNFGQCASVVGAACTRAAELDSVRLLAHEQLHFDIPCVLAYKANAAQASGTAVTLAGVRARANTLTTQYDNQTNHGCNAAAQATWEQDVGSGSITL